MLSVTLDFSVCFKYHPIFTTLQLGQQVVSNHICQLQSLKLTTLPINFTRNGSCRMGPTQLTDSGKINGCTFSFKAELE